MRTAALLLLLAATSAAAQDSLNAEAFEAYVTGKTLVYRDATGSYGIEEYREGRAVTWSFLDGECSEGIWYPSGEHICFAYEGLGAPQCWTFERGASGLIARFAGVSGSEIFETRQTDVEITCLGPKVGS